MGEGSDNSGCNVPDPLNEICGITEATLPFKKVQSGNFVLVTS